jgi:hypothetical protein
MSHGDITANEVYQDRETLERLGFGIMDVAWGSSGIGSDNIRDFSYIISPNQDPKMYRRLVFEILGRYFENSLAKEMWNKFIDHKWVMSERAGKEIGLETAAQDWFKEYSHDFLKDWTFRREVIPERIRNNTEPKKDLSSLVAGYLIPGLRELLDAGFTVTDIIFAVFKTKISIRKLAINWRTRSGRFKLGSVSMLGRNKKLSESEKANTKSKNTRRKINKPYLFVKKVKPGEQGAFYVHLVAKLTGHPIKTGEEAEKHWHEILEHKWYLSERKGRDIGIKVAALDYYRRLNLLQAAELGQES